MLIFYCLLFAWEVLPQCNFPFFLDISSKHVHDCSKSNEASHAREVHLKSRLASCVSRRAMLAFSYLIATAFALVQLQRQVLLKEKMALL